MKFLHFTLTATTLFTLACLTILGLMPAFALAASDNTIFGTSWIKYQPIQASGELQGCEIVFMAVTADYLYLEGNPVAVNGSIALRKAPNNNLGLTLKVGLKDLIKNSPFERPTFAYLQTASASTAKAEQVSVEGDTGYRLYFYSFYDPVILEIFKEMITTNQVTLAYNRRKQGTDMLVPLDLLVVDSELTVNETMIRQRSPEAAKGFSACVEKVIDDVAKKLGEK